MAPYTRSSLSSNTVASPHGGGREGTLPFPNWSPDKWAIPINKDTPPIDEVISYTPVPYGRQTRMPFDPGTEITCLLPSLGTKPSENRKEGLGDRGHVDFGVKWETLPLCLKGKLYANHAFVHKGKILRQGCRSVHNDSIIRHRIWRKIPL